VIACVRCHQPVNGPAPGVGGVPVHTGHVEPSLDQSCGWWGFETVEAQP
jgi:kynureninase